MNKKNDNIDLIDLIKKLIKNKAFIILFTLFFSLLGIIYSLSLDNIYASSSTFYPHSENTNINSLESIAGIAGISLNKNDYNETPTSLYPNIIQSIPYKEEILNSKILLNSSQTSYKEYLLSEKKSILQRFFKIFENKAEPSESNKFDLSYDKKELKLFKKLNDVIIISINKKDGYIKLTVYDKSPEVAYQIARISLEKLQERIISFKIKNSEELYSFTTEQFNKRQKEFYHLQDSLAKIKDSNKYIKSDLFSNQVDRLEYEVNLANSIYKELAITKEKTLLDIKKNTPIFTIINPVIYPYEKSKPFRTIIVIIFTIIGLLFSISFVILNDHLVYYKKNLFNF